jgi:hypothetical protein
MTVALVAAVIAAIALAALLAALLFWQMKRAAHAGDELKDALFNLSELRIAEVTSRVALADKERALNITIAERDRLQFTCDTLEDQRDALLTEAFESSNPGAVAGAVRNALERLRNFPPKLPEAPDAEALPDVSST